MPQAIIKDDAVSAADAVANAEAAQAALDAFASVDEPVKKPEVKQETKVENTDAEKAAETKAAEEAAAKAAIEAEWEGVPVKVRQTLEAITGKVGTLDMIEHRLKGVEGRTGAALHGVYALKTALDAAKTVDKAGGDAPSQEQIAAAASSDEEWEKLLADFPDWKDGIDKRIDQRLDARLQKLAPPPAVDVAGLKSELTGTVDEIVAKATSETKAETRALAQVDRKYETWEQDIYVDGDRSKAVLTPEFKAWQAAQPPEVRALANSPNPRDAIKMLDAFYEHRKAVADATAKAERDKKRLDRAITPKGVTTGQVNRNMTEEEARYQGFASVDT